MMRIALVPIWAAPLALPATALAEPTPITADQATQHVVQPGETLGGIANRAKVPRILIAEANGLTDPYVVRAGQTLRIPRTRRHEVEKGDTGFGVSYRYAVPWKDIAVANGLDIEAPLKPGQTLLIPTIIARPDPAAVPAAVKPAAPGRSFAWPVAGSVRRGFTARGQRNYHDGLDIKVPEGTAVRAAAAGKVLFAGEQDPQFGNLVVLDHGEGWHTAYGFLSRITVRNGEDVKKGERIGLSGRTGQAKGPELHFEIRNNAEPVDPAGQLPARP